MMEKKPKGIPRHIWLTSLLALYFLAMMMLYAKDWVESGHTWLIVVSAIFELAVIIALYIALKKKAQNP